MRIVYLSTDFGIPLYGNKGASIHIRELSSALESQGHQVTIITCRTGGDTPAGFGVPVHEFGLSGPERLFVESLQDDPKADEPTVREVRAMLYNATLRLRLLPLLHALRPDAIYERYALLGTAGLDLAHELDIPHILEVNAPLSEEQVRYRGSAFAQTVRAVEQRVLTATDQVIAVSEPLKQWIVSAGGDEDRVAVVPNGVNIVRFASTPEDVRSRLCQDGRPVVGFVGTLKAWHGTETLIRAIALLRRELGEDNAPQLLIVGDGPQREHLEQIAREEGIIALTNFTGMVAHDEIPAWINAMDIAVAPYDATPDFYFSPLKLFEYMAAGRPVIAADIGQIADCIREGETGLLYPPGDVPALSQRIEHLLKNPDLGHALGRAAQGEAQENRSWDRNARIVIELAKNERARSAASMAILPAEGGT